MPRQVGRRGVSHCGGNRVTQAIAAFSAVTSKKS